MKEGGSSSNISRDVDEGKERRLFLAHDGLLVLARHVVPLGAVLKTVMK